MTWRAYALCSNKNQDFWYPSLESETPEQFYTVGRAVCHACPVWKECLADGKKEIWGMWGGLTPIERSVFTASPKKNALKAHGTPTRYRQGCKCAKCTNMHKKATSRKLNTNYIPDKNIKNYDLIAVLYHVL
jgi:hypothetical protein